MQALRSWMIALTCGLMIAGFLPVLPPIFAALSLGLVGAYTGVLGKRWHIFLGGGCVGLCLGCLYGSALLSRQPVDGCLSDEAVVTGSVLGLVDRREIRPGQNRQRFQFKIIRWQPLECSGPQRLLLSYYGGDPIATGQPLKLLIATRRNWGQVNPGSVSFQSWYAFAGIDATGTVKSVLKPQVAAQPFSVDVLATLRTHLNMRIDSADLPGESKALLRALVTGDKSGITPAMWQRFQVMGINHLFVISGLHVGLVAALGYGLGGSLCRVIQLLRGPPLLAVAPICAFACAYAYAGLAGFSLSTQRALLMTGCFLLASVLSRASRSWQALLIAACGVLLVNPLSMLSAGFWLSFVAVAWLLWIAPFLGGGNRPVTLYVRSVRLIGLHGSLCLMMFPLTLWWFGGASVLSPIVNFVFVPLVSLYVVPLVLVGTVMAAVDLPLWAWVWEGAMWPLTTLLMLLEQIVPAVNQLYWTGATQVLDVALALAGLVLWPVCMHFRSRALALILFAPALLARAIDDSPASVSFLDVGQGTAVVIQSRQHTLVYDTGGGDPSGHNSARSVIVPFLRSRGVTQIDTFVVSHPDLDHSAGVTTLLGEFPVQRTYASQRVPGLHNASLCRTGLAFFWSEGVRFQFLGPSDPAMHSSNDASCVLRITLPNKQVLLLPGDIGAARELDIIRFWGAQLDSDYLLAAHHGSRTSTSPAWLKWVSPRVVIITHGKANPFGHPHEAVVKRIRQAGLTLESTAERGALLFEQAHSGQVVVHGWRQRQNFYWL